MDNDDFRNKNKKWFEEIEIKNKKRDSKISKLVSNTDYIEWLGRFTEKTKGFYDDTELYSLYDLEEGDKNNIEDLGLFFTGINKYARRNYIYPTQCDYGMIYKIKYNDKKFEIGMTTELGYVSYFCDKGMIDNDDYLDFYDIMNNKEQGNVKMINLSLDFVKGAVIKAYENGAPSHEIYKTVGDTLKELSEGKQKILIRK